jgi:hypothetical protein
LSVGHGIQASSFVVNLAFYFFPNGARDGTVSEVFGLKVGSIERHQTFSSDLKPLPYAAYDFVFSASRAGFSTRFASLTSSMF